MNIAKFLNTFFTEHIWTTTSLYTFLKPYYVRGSCVALQPIFHLYIHRNLIIQSLKCSNSIHLTILLFYFNILKDCGQISLSVGSEIW